MILTRVLLIIFLIITIVCYLLLFCSKWQELQVATVSRYLGRHCSLHVAEYTALMMGLETALQRGVKHLTVMCDSMTVFNQVCTSVGLVYR